MQRFFSRVKSGRDPGFPRFRARSPYRSFSVDVPKASGSALRIRDAGRRGESRWKALTRIEFAVRSPLPRPDRIRGFRVARKARRIEVQLPFEPVLPAVRTGAPERPLGLDAGIRSFATLSDFGGGECQRKPAVHLRCKSQSTGNSALRRKCGKVRRSVARRRRCLHEPVRGLRRAGGNQSITSPTRL